MMGNQPTTRCKKQRFKSRIDALIALSRIQWRDKSWRPKQETRAYLCERCYGWHLTSKPKRRG